MKNFKILLLASTVLLTANFALAQIWTQTSAPNTNWTSIASSADGTKLVAVADLGGIWVSTDSGGTWTQTSAPQSGWFRVASSADGSGLAAIGEPRPFRGSSPFLTQARFTLRRIQGRHGYRTMCLVCQRKQSVRWPHRQTAGNWRY